MNENPLVKITQKLENEVLIAFVNWQLIDIGCKRNPVLAKAASSCYQSMVKSRSNSWHFFMSEFIMTNPLHNIVKEFDWLQYEYILFLSFLLCHLYLCVFCCTLAVTAMMTSMVYSTIYSPWRVETIQKDIAIRSRLDQKVQTELFILFHIVDANVCFLVHAIEWLLLVLHFNYRCHQIGQWQTDLDLGMHPQFIWSKFRW